MNGRPVILRVRLRVSGRDGLDIRRRQGGTGVFDGMLVHHPVDEIVRQVDDGLLGTTRLGHIHTRIVRNELAQELG
jgi:hypothetical protein